MPWTRRWVGWYTDCRSLSDHLTNVNAAAVSDKRLAIDLTSLRQELWRERGQLVGNPTYCEALPADRTTLCMWVATKTMPADSLTQADEKPADGHFDGEWISAYDVTKGRNQQLAKRILTGVKSNLVIHCPVLVWHFRTVTFSCRPFASATCWWLKPSKKACLRLPMPLPVSYIYLSSYLAVSLSICLSTYPSIYRSIFLICLSNCVSSYLTKLSIYLSIDVSMYRSIYASIYLCICLSIYLSSYLTI